jgi:hypothetical protein
LQRMTGAISAEGLEDACLFTTNTFKLCCRWCLGRGHTPPLRHAAGAKSSISLVSHIDTEHFCCCCRWCLAREHTPRLHRAAGARWR